MVEFFRSGGFAMLIILLLGGLTLAAAVALILRPEKRLVAVIRALSRATVFASLAGFAAGLGMTMTAFSRRPEWATDAKMPLIAMAGIGESLANPILGFSLLAVAWLVAAVGLRRMHAAGV